MLQTAEGCLEFLEKARDSVEELSIVADRELQLEQDEKRLKKELETEKKLIADTIAQTVRKRRDEISASYETEIGKLQEQLKKARSRREKARSQRVKDRIKEETSVPCEHNRELRAQMKTVFRQGHVPRICLSRLYYSLYFPRWFKEYLVLFLFVAVGFLAVPWGIYQLLPDQKPLYLAGIYLADIIVLGGFYMTVGNRTKLHHMEELKQGRQFLDQIHANNKKIAVITSTIRKDKNESQYDLEKYDDEISRLTQAFGEVTAKKQEALSTFDSVTSNILQDEIEHNHREKLDSLKTAYDNVQEQLMETAAEIKEKRLYITDHYETHLGREFLDPFRLSELVQIIQNGEASNISESIEVYQKRKTG